MLCCFAVTLLLGSVASKEEQWDRIFPTSKQWDPIFPTSSNGLDLTTSTELMSLRRPEEPTKVKPNKRFSAYNDYITGPTPSFQHEYGPDRLLDCSGGGAGSLTAPSFNPLDLEAARRMETLIQRYSRLRSHKPLVKHQLTNSASFLRRLLGRIGQDPTDADFETGLLDTSRSIPLRFIKALNNVAGETSTVVGYLWAFGYLPKVMNIALGDEDEAGSLSVQENATPCQLVAAIEQFQKFNGLSLTRQMDAATVLKMKKARCGMPDVAAQKKKKKKKKKRHSRSKRYVLRRRGWNIKNDLTYFVKNCTAKLTHRVCKEQIKLGLERWTDYAPIVFREVASAERANFVLYFVRGEHPKKNLEAASNDNPFDGPGGVLAHAYFPKGGHIHFDDEEEFTANSDDGVNMQFITMHEMGHALGLEHSDVADSAMAPVYDPGKGWRAAVRLRYDDIAAIRAKYGTGKGRVITL